ncbi:hypothetical protein DFO73_11877 [Cytobacillus oceanisediminis]|uniref:Uncharacterized protein n=1 Tax=Cytobacillus oceanisediminis TaxID=665099 RepID=A0A2V2ZIY2_9BACI|nr:hypothetical protein DFO73_11877 [Cytobacillus oceanisediminis]
MILSLAMVLVTENNAFLPGTAIGPIITSVGIFIFV